jgi:hypothetical protein
MSQHARRDLAPYLARLTTLEHWMEILYSPSTLQLQRCLTDLVKENSRLHNNAQSYFTHLGNVYEVPLIKPIYEGPPNTLHPKLRGAFEEYIREKEKLAEEKDRISAFLQRLLVTTMAASDINHILPCKMQLSEQQIRNLGTQAVSLSNDSRKQFIETNKPYLDLIKMRLAFNLIDT